MLFMSAGHIQVQHFRLNFLIEANIMDRLELFLLLELRLKVPFNNNSVMFRLLPERGRKGGREKLMG